MKAIVAIALNTFREAVRNRILYIILIFALLLMASSWIVRDLTISAHGRVVQDFGLSCISFFGLAIAILVGIGLVYNELDKKSIYTIVSKPVGRWQFLLGKYFGLLLTIYVNVLIMAVFFLAVVHYLGALDEIPLYGDEDNFGWLYTRYIVASVFRSAGLGVMNTIGIGIGDLTRELNVVVYLIMVELAIITAFAILFSSFSTPTLSAIFTLMTLVAGRMNQDIWWYAQGLVRDGLVETTAGLVKYWLAMGACVVMPNLGAFRVSLHTLNQGQPVIQDWFMLWHMLGYATLYSASILGLSILIFRSRNFK
jgi:ABC-type transport system involved in multi-copper enzyme maturation permease subunit